MSLRALVVAFIVSLASPILASAQLPESKTTKPQIRRETYSRHLIGWSEYGRLGIYLIDTLSKHYSPTGLLLKSAEGYFPGCLEWDEYRRYVYNSKGQCIENIGLDSRDNPIGERTLYSYDSTGRYIKERTLKLKTEDNEKKIEYLANLIERSYNEQGFVDKIAMYRGFKTIEYYE